MTKPFNARKAKLVGDHPVAELINDLVMLKGFSVQRIAAEVGCPHCGATAAIRSVFRYKKGASAPDWWVKLLKEWYSGEVSLNDAEVERLGKWARSATGRAWILEHAFDEPDFDQMKVADLRALATVVGIRGNSKLSKAHLLEALRDKGGIRRWMEQRVAAL